MKKNKKYCLIQMKYSFMERDEDGHVSEKDKHTKKIVLSGKQKDILDRIHHAEEELEFSHKSKIGNTLESIKLYLKRHLILWKDEYYTLLKM